MDTSRALLKLASSYYAQTGIPATHAFVGEQAWLKIVAELPNCWEITRERAMEIARQGGSSTMLHGLHLHVLVEDTDFMAVV